VKLLLILILNVTLLFLPLSISAQEEQDISPVILNATLTKDPTVISSPGIGSYMVNLPATFHFIERPDLNYTLSIQDKLRLHIVEVVFFLIGDFKVVEENATSVGTEFLMISGSASYDSQNYDKGSGITTYYDADKGHDNNIMSSEYLTIGDMSWSDIEYVLKTFDNGTGVFSLYAES
jgi:hypothetical protein